MMQGKLACLIGSAAVAISSQAQAVRVIAMTIQQNGISQGTFYVGKSPSGSTVVANINFVGIELTGAMLIRFQASSGANSSLVETNLPPPQRNHL